MAQTFYPITPTEITAGAADEWTNMDASALIASGATGVILHCESTADPASLDIGLRKPGSTDDRHQDINYKTHFWAMIGVDGSRTFEAYVGNTTFINIYVVGYTMAGVTFATNADDKSPGSYDDWIEMDCSSEAPSAIGLIFERVGGAESECSLRKEGSTDDRPWGFATGHSAFGGVIGCDESQVCEGYLGNEWSELWLVGYITDGVTFNTNAADYSLGSAGSYADLSALPDESPVMGIFEIHMGIKYFGLRKKGESGGHADIYLDAATTPWAIIECDEDRLIEGKIEHTQVDFWLVGYPTIPAAGWTGKISGVTNPAKIMGVPVADIVKVKGVE